MVRISKDSKKFSVMFSFRNLIVLFLTVYHKAVAPLMPAACRFYPTCSVYTAQAIRIYGLGRGFWLGFRRLSRCHPWHAGGYDPVS